MTATVMIACLMSIPVRGQCHPVMTHCSFVSEVATNVANHRNSLADFGMDGCFNV
jgi:hypothetical protein